MDFLDIIVIIPSVWFAFKGFQKGLVFEVAGIIALIIGTYIAINFSNKVATTLNLSGQYVEIIAFIITFGLVIFLVFILAKLIEKIIKLILPDIINNLGGAIFGVCKVLLIISIILYFINSYDKNEVVINKTIKEKSLLYKPLTQLSEIIFPEFEKIRNQKIKDI